MIQNLYLEFSQGMTAIVGDSGAGKSIILDAIALILGDRASQGLIRDSEKSASVTAVFGIYANKLLCKLLEDAGYTAKDDDLVIKKVIYRDSSSKIFINDMPSTTAFVKNIATQIVEIHGQMMQMDILNTSSHINILDRYLPDQELIQQVRKSHAVYKEKLEIYSTISMQLEAQEKLLSELEDAQRDLEECNIYDGEETELIAKRSELLQSAKIADTLNLLHATLSGIEIGKINSCATKLSGVQLHESADFESIIIEINDVSDRISSLRDNISQMRDSYSQPAYEIEKIEQRIDKIRDIARKYRIPSSNLFAYLSDIQQKVEKIYSLRQAKTTYSNELEGAKNVYRDLAEKLSNIRGIAAKDMSEKITTILRNLEIPDAEFEINVAKINDKISENGMDDVMFLASLNKDRQKNPVIKVASGGELSRIMLAIKSVMSERFSFGGLIIFDEIETGLSSNVAMKVAKVLGGLSGNIQVIAITHNPYIAGIANEQFNVIKHEENGQINTTARKLPQEDRIHSIAKMISVDAGKEAQDIARKILSGQVFKKI